MLKITDARVTFNPGAVSEVKALRGVSLELAEGEFLMVIGTNGSGKSTLQNAVAGSVLLDSGKIELAGRDVTRWPEHRRAAHVGRVFQNPFSGTAPSMTIAENIAMAMCRGRGRGLGWALGRKCREDIRERVRSLDMGLEDRLLSPIGTLSGGQRQAITLLMATWNRPDILLLDEHTAALDPKSAEKIIALTQRLVKSQSLTTLMVTHSMWQAASFGTRLVMTRGGRIEHDITGQKKAGLRPGDLLDMFEEIRREELLDESVAEMLRRRF